MIPEDLLEIICCPESHQTLRLADSTTIDRLNQKIAAGQLSNRAGQSISEKIDAALVREDGKFAYPIREDIPILLIDEAIPLSQ
jgi:uncharacterized protein YbaR (Trm112 family)